MTDLIHLPQAKLDTLDLVAMLNILCSPSVAPSCLTFAAETAGKRWPDVPSVYNALLKLLAHESPLVREGAIYGLMHFTIGDKARRAIREIASGDDCEVLREIARAFPDGEGS